MTNMLLSSGTNLPLSWTRALLQFLGGTRIKAHVVVSETAAEVALADGSAEQEVPSHYSEVVGVRETEGAGIEPHSDFGVAAVLPDQ